MSAIRASQGAARKELGAVAARIEALKAERQGKLLPGGGELDASLRKSQELSASLTELAQKLAQAESRLEKEHAALLQALADELARLRAEVERHASTDGGEREKRAQLLETMRKLRAEREQVRSALPASAVPPLRAELASSDDPVDLLEQADALRDNEDKVRRELRALEKLMAERREEHELDRRMSEFLGDEAIFDEQDRRFRLQGSSPSRSGGFTAKESAPDHTSVPPPAMSEPALGAGTGRDLGPNDKASTTGAGPSGARPNDARPYIGSKRGSMGADADLPALEEKHARLKGLAEELKARADKLEQKARSLR